MPVRRTQSASIGSLERSSCGRSGVTSVPTATRRWPRSVSLPGCSGSVPVGGSWTSAAGRAGPVCTSPARPAARWFSPMCPSRVSPPRRAGQPGKTWAAGPGRSRHAARCSRCERQPSTRPSTPTSCAACAPSWPRCRRRSRCSAAGDRTAFTAIFPASGLTAAEARRAIEAGPPNCGLRTSYPSLLRSAGFVEIDERDLTADYFATASRKLEVAEQFAEDMIEMLGRPEYDEMQAERRLAIAAIDGGLLRRSLFVARRPQRM